MTLLEKKRKTFFYLPNFKSSGTYTDCDYEYFFQLCLNTCSRLFSSHVYAQEPSFSLKWPPCMAHTVKWVRSVSCQWVSHLQSWESSSYFRTHSAQQPDPECVNNILRCASQPKSTRYTACRVFESTLMHVCVNMARRERMSSFIAFESVWISLLDGVYSGWVQQVLYTHRGTLCAEIREGGPQGGDEWRKRNSCGDENLTHISLARSLFLWLLFTPALRDGSSR